jgi:pimeloyl-ACP methyl ester carboxylesterase
VPSDPLRPPRPGPVDALQREEAGLAQFAALQCPDRVRTLTLISSVPQYGNPILLFRYIRFPGPFRLIFRRYGDGIEDKKQMLIDVARLPKNGIAAIRQPVVAINGDEDPLVRPAAGRKIAATVKDGRFVLVHQMGHLFAEPLWSQIVSEIDRTAV